MFAKGSSSLIHIIGFDSVVIKECRPNCERSLGVVLLFDHPSNEVLKAFVNSVGLSNRNMVYTKVSIDLFLGQVFKLDHFVVVNRVMG